MQGLIMGPVAAALLALGGLTFEEFSPKEGGFTVLMPGKPQKKQMSKEGLTATAYGVNVANGAYLVVVTPLPPGQPFSIDKAIEGQVAHHEGKVLSSKRFRLGGETGKEFEAESGKPKGYLSGRVIVIDNRLYQVVAAGTEGRLSNPDVRKFLDSFKLKK
jgi:hypothetical protein